MRRLAVLWTMAWLPAAVAASDLEVEVVPDSAWLAPKTPKTPRPPVPELAVLELSADGRSDEWVDVAEAPPLLALARGPRPPNGAVRFATTDEGGLALMSPWTDGNHVLVVDANGDGQRWLEVHLSKERVLVLRCGYPQGFSMAEPMRLNPRVLPCEREQDDAGVELVVSDVLEAHLPPSLVALRSSTRLGFSLLRDGKYVGTWATNGAPGLLPTSARRILGPGGPALRFSPGEESAIDVALAGAEDGTWTWAVHRWGGTTQTGSVEVSDGAAHWSIETDGGYGDVLLVEGPDVDAPVPTALARTVPVWLSRVRVITPVHAGVASLRFELSRDHTGRLVVREPSGAVLAEAEVSLPAGTGELHLSLAPEWPASVEIWLGPRLIGHVLRSAP